MVQYLTYTISTFFFRRARENKGMLTKLKEEKRLLTKELGRRIMTGQLIHRHEGDYTPVGFEETMADRRKSVR